MRFNLKTQETLSCRAGFTLVEILIVVIILGILASIVVPKFSKATDEARANSIHMSLHRVRQQLEIYKQQHDGELPTLADFEAQMSTATDSGGNTAAIGTAGFPYGPYIREIPTNAMTDTNTIGDGVVGTSDWYYDESEGTFQANNTAVARSW